MKLQQPGQGQLLNQEQKLNNKQHLSQVRLSQSHEMNTFPDLCTKTDMEHPSMEEILRVMVQVEEFKTFDDAAIFFSMSEWKEWKEVEGFFHTPVIEGHFDSQVLEDFSQVTADDLIERPDSGNGGMLEICCTGILNINEVKIPGENEKKLLPDRVLATKERLENIHYSDKKTPSIFPGTPEKQLQFPVNTEPISQATRDTSGDWEHSSVKEMALCAESGKCSFLQPPPARHPQEHWDLKSYRCTDCGNIFFSKTLFDKHQTAHHQVRSYNCTDRGQHLHSQALLLGAKHHELNGYNCTECGKSFKQKARFDYHWSTHTGVKAFGCSECGVCFNRKGPLAHHLWADHGKTPPPDTASARNKAIEYKQ